MEVAHALALRKRPPGQFHATNAGRETRILYELMR
jgi:hypothetical protein